MLSPDRWTETTRRASRRRAAVHVEEDGTTKVVEAELLHRMWLRIDFERRQIETEGRQAQRRLIYLESR